MYENIKYISSHGIAHRIDNTIKLTQNSVNYNFNYNERIVYIRIVDIIQFFENYIDNFYQPIIVVTGDMDTLVPIDIPNIESYINHPKLIVWYAQNLIIKEQEKLKHIPIGLDYHTLSINRGNNHEWGQYQLPIEQENMIEKIRSTFIDIKDTRVKAVTNFHLAMDNPPRRKMLREPIYNMLKNNKNIIWLPKQTREEFWKSLNKCMFVICPFGNGFDTHRTWEVLIMNRIPIIPKCDMNKIFEGLPVIEIDNNRWDIITEEWLLLKKEEIIKKWSEYKFERLTLEWWLNKIRSNLI